MSDLEAAGETPDGERLLSSPSAVEPEPEAADAQTRAAADREDHDEDPDESPTDLLEIEHDGRTYTVAAELKDAFLRHADYTRKTQDLAEQRRAFEQQNAEEREAVRRDLETHARLVALGDQIGAYERIDWDTLEREDPVRAQTLWRQYTQLKDGRAELAGQLQHQQELTALQAQREAARRVEEGHAALARDIPGWSPDLSNKLGAFAHSEFGFTPEEVSSVADPRMVRVLHLAQIGHQTQQQQAAAKKAAASQAAAPIGKVGASSPAGRNPDRMTTDEWMAFERERLRRKA